MRDKTT